MIIGFSSAFPTKRWKSKQGQPALSSGTSSQASHSQSKFISTGWSTLYILGKYYRCLYSLSWLHKRAHKIANAINTNTIILNTHPADVTFYPSELKWPLEVAI